MFPPRRLRASFHHRVRKTKNTGPPSWWSADGGKEVAQAPLLHRRWVKASGWKCTLAWECQRAIVAKIRWCRPGTGSATRSRITYRIWDNGKRKPDWLAIHSQSTGKPSVRSALEPASTTRSRGRGTSGIKVAGIYDQFFFRSCGWKNTASRFIDPVFFRVSAYVSLLPIVYFRSKMILVWDREEKRIVSLKKWIIFRAICLETLYLLVFYRVKFWSTFDTFNCIFQR